MMKKLYYFPILLIVTSVVLLTSCTFRYNSDVEYKSPDQLAVELQSEIMECFINNDREAIKDFFCPYVLENQEDIDTQIDEAFDIIDGKIVSYNDPFPGACGSSDKKSYGADTRKIMTDKGTEYKIDFKGWLTNSEEPDKVGVLHIRVVDKTVEYDRKKSDKENGILYIGDKTL